MYDHAAYTHTHSIYTSSIYIQTTGTVVVFTLDRSFYPTTSAVPPVSFLIPHLREIQSLVTDCETEKNQALKNHGRQIKC